MPKTALVLSGGGAKGAFEAGAERYAREVKGYEWDIIAGVSVGALNAGMLAMKKYDGLWRLWGAISDAKVYTGRTEWWYIVWRVVTGRKSILGNDPLGRLIESEFDPALVDAELIVGAVSLMSGEYVQFEPDTPHFTDGVLASTAIPVYWAPVDVEGQGPMVDGGVRNVSPLGDVLEYNPDEVVIINCNPREPRVETESPGSVIDVATRSLDIAVNEIFVGDIREFLRINRNVKEAEAGGVTLHKDDGTPYKFFEHKLIEPPEHLGDGIDFSQPSVRASMRAGWEAAEAVFGAPASGPVPFPEPAQP